MSRPWPSRPDTARDVVPKVIDKDPWHDRERSVEAVTDAHPLRPLIEAAAEAFRHHGGDASNHLASALRALSLEPLCARPATFPVCRSLARSLSAADAQPASLVGTIDRVQNLLCWRRARPERIPEPFLHHYAFVEICGPEGMVEANDFRFGLYLQAPGADYPPHCHEAEELYLIVSGTAQWQTDDGEFAARPPGTLIHHLPWQWHATRTQGQPLLALWSWAGNISLDSYRISEQSP